MDEINYKPLTECNRLIYYLLSLSDLENFNNDIFFYHKKCLKSFYTFRIYDNVSMPISEKNIRDMMMRMKEILMMIL